MYKKSVHIKDIAKAVTEKQIPAIILPTIFGEQLIPNITPKTTMTIVIIIMLTFRTYMSVRCFSIMPSISISDEALCWG
ncbi:MAG: hypothetical protein IKP73_03650 [Bacteroidales bacterium]|nr:hypothetical protein [Bacteroidales bacterium]